MNDHDPKQALLWRLATQFVEDEGHLDEDAFGQSVVDFLSQHPELDPDAFVDACVHLYVDRSHGDPRHH
ncbi:hypothetical protein SLNSH_02800 [Alsobacter soli]|uniref:Uncharacterized protein n=1 Tax=Alsobacter soli TaxID=2109933 RepID=A0A2T1HYH1_9HYPH|nr:hypothetical protein SLNSH_02800 [Alsobacter soli]